ncbi:MAG: hydrogenase maturation nickel metallochaperone HypA [Candidatus Omnitrophota bacterium]|jgi:Zn finger protein HypA/HybF involved in hydrogenase expression
MHETVFINEIFTILKQKLDKNNISAKVTVNVRLSPFSHVAFESLQESFKELRGGNFKNVSLNILPLEITLECKDCKRRSSIIKEIFSCPFCGSMNVGIQMDKEFFVESIEVESE